MDSELLKIFGIVIAYALFVSLLVGGFTYIVMNSVSKDPCIRWTVDGTKHEFCLK